MWMNVHVAYYIIMSPHLYHSFSVNILEVLPKDKKAKEEKTAVLGQATFDLLPVLMGEVSNSPLTLSLHTTTEMGGASAADAASENVSEIDKHMHVHVHVYMHVDVVNVHICRMLKLMLR